MACDFCKDEYCEDRRDLMSFDKKLSHKGDFSPGIQICINGDILSAMAIADVYEPNFTEKEIKINFCPMCGRKLSA